MTNEEAKDLLDNLIGMVEDNHSSDYDTALQMGIKALEFIDKIEPMFGDMLDIPKASVKPQGTGHCEDCKHFRKLPYHADTLGKCVHHGGFCPKGDWYCADYEPQESEG